MGAEQNAGVEVDIVDYQRIILRAANADGATSELHMSAGSATHVAELLHAAVCTIERERAKTPMRPSAREAL